MSQITGWYYLHENKELIYKNDPAAVVDIRESDLCRAAWPIDVEDRAGAWNLLVGANALGANPERIKELAAKWNCTNEDAVNYAEYLDVTLGIDGELLTCHRRDLVNLQENECGFGDTYLNAMSDLCKKLGYTGGKMGWHSSFKQLCSVGSETIQQNAH